MATGRIIGDMRTHSDGYSDPARRDQAGATRERREPMTNEPAASMSGADDTEPELCIVAPAFDEAETLGAFVAAVTQALDDAGITHEILIVDDGSHDATPAVLRDLVARDARVRGCILSRNFGHQAAVSTGLAQARGRAVAVMDADLQDRPSDLVTLVQRWREGGADVVYAVRRDRKEAWPLRLAYWTFYRILDRLSSVRIPLDSGDFCVMDAAFVRKLNALPERLRFVRGLRAWLGGTQVPVEVERDRRHAGQSHYTFARLVRLAADGLVSFSRTPLQIATVLGAVVATLSFLVGLVVLYWKLRGMLPAGGGIATLAVGVFFVGGVQLFCIGLLGEYVGRLFEEVKGRPTAVIAEELRHGVDL